MRRIKAVSFAPYVDKAAAGSGYGRLAVAFEGEPALMNEWRADGVPPEIAEAVSRQMVTAAVELPQSVRKRPLLERVEWLLRRPVPVEENLLLAQLVVARDFLDQLSREVKNG